MFLKETEEAESVLRERLLSYCELAKTNQENRLRQIKGFKRLENVREFRELLESGASIDTLVRHPSWGEEKLPARIDKREFSFRLVETDNVDA